MKNYLLIISVLTLISCHTKKRISEIKTTDQHAILQISDNSKTQINLKTSRTDSSKTLKSDIENINYLTSFDMEFDLFPIKEKSILTNQVNRNDDFLNQLLDKSNKVKIHINHTQQKFNSQLLTQQNDIKSKTNSSVSKEGTYKQVQKIDIKEKNKLNSESKTYTSLMWWVVAAGILITVYLLNKFNIPALILGFFKL